MKPFYWEANQLQTVKEKNMLSRKIVWLLLGAAMIFVVALSYGCEVCNDTKDQPVCIRDCSDFLESPFLSQLDMEIFYEDVVLHIR